MIQNLWHAVQITCGCHNDQKIPMVPHEGSTTFVQGGVQNSLFYSCPKYYPDQRNEGEKPCFNRLSIDEYEDLIMHLSNLLEDAECSGATVNLAGIRWKNKKGTLFEVLKHNSKGIRVAVMNRQVQHLAKSK